MTRFYAMRVLTTVCLTIFLPTLSHADTTNLLDYMNGNIHPPATSATVPPYNRAKQFGGWVDQDPLHPCYDTREMVLDREADPNVSVTFKPPKNCTIDEGLWHEPYTGADVTSAADLQIDHVVPLALAYYAGAYAWKGPTRCTYANFIANGFHLRAVNGHENVAKGDRGPDNYLPPNEADHCSYVSDWMKIKAIWQLTTTQSEIDAILNVINDENCDPSLLNMDSNELAKQRLTASQPIAACANFAD